MGRRGQALGGASPRSSAASTTIQTSAPLQTARHADEPSAIRDPAAATLTPVRRVREHGSVDAWVTGAIGICGTLSGTGLGYVGAVRISRRDRAAALRGQIRSAAAVYLGALYQSVGELRDLPPKKTPNALDRGVSKLQGEQGACIARRRAEYRLSGDRYRQLAGQLASAAAQLHVLPLPPDLDAAVAAANEHVEKLSDRRTPELIAEWPAVRASLLAATKKLNES
jgi:hypothetical protein